MATKETPKYQHDCEECIFLGRADGETMGCGPGEVDLYYHNRDMFHQHNYVVRTSSEGGHYHYGPIENDPSWPYAIETYRRALALGLVEEMPEVPPSSPLAPFSEREQAEWAREMQGM